MALLIIANAIALGALFQVGAAQDRLSKAQIIRVTAADTKYQRYLTRFDIRQYVLKGKLSDSQAESSDTAALSSDEDQIATLAKGDPEVTAILADLTPLTAKINDRNALQVRAIQTDPVAMLASFQGKPATGLGADVQKSLADNTVDIPKEMDLLYKLDGLTADRVKAAQASLQSTFSLGVTIAVVAGTLALVLGLGIVLVFGRFIVKRLILVRDALYEIVSHDMQIVREAFKQLSTGDLTAKVDLPKREIHVRGGDEIADLMVSYNALAIAIVELSDDITTMVDNLSFVVGGVASATLEFTSVSGRVDHGASETELAISEISLGMDSVAKGANSQMNSIRDISVAIEELSRTAEQIALGARDQAAALQGAAESVQAFDGQVAALSNIGSKLASTARETADQASAGVQTVHETSSSMTSVRESSKLAEQAMRVLQERSQAVGEIVSTIEEIADQSNLLALNAAIEAARAGEHGRGFAVVADEVRKLAERSSSSTREIGSILGAIRQEIDHVSNAMRSSTTALDQSNDRFERLDRLINALQAAISDTSLSAQDMMERANAMNAATASLTEHVGSVSTVVEENAAAANQMRATSHHVAGAILPVAAAAEEQAAAAEEISQSAVQLTSHVKEMTRSSSHVRDEAKRLEELVSIFRLAENGSTLPPSGKIPTLAP